MTLDEREHLATLGISLPEPDGQQLNGNRYSVEDLDEVLTAQQDSKFTVTTDRAEAVFSILTRAKASSNPALFIDAMLSALNALDEDMTLEQLAKIHGVTKQHVSNVRNSIRDNYNLPQPPGGRSNRIRRKQSREVKQKHWRKQAKYWEAPA